jgi:hypothetical protein
VNLYTQMVGGIGDLLIAMMRPGSHLGYFPALRARGHSTMVVAHANTDAAAALFEALPYVDYLKFRGMTRKIDTSEGRSFEALKRWNGLPWMQPAIALDDGEAASLRALTREPYVAVHITASLPHKVPPEFEKLLAGLREAGVRVVLLGVEPNDMAPAVKGNRVRGFRSLVGGEILVPPQLRLHVALAQGARKFIGTLSCFNCAAQLASVPSFVIVDRSLKEPTIYRMMAQNGAIVEPWNVGKPIEAIYKDAVEWAKC